MEDDLLDLLSGIGYWHIEGVNQHSSDLCVEIGDFVKKFTMSKDKAEKILRKIREIR